MSGHIDKVIRSSISDALVNKHQHLCHLNLTSPPKKSSIPKNCQWILLHCLQSTLWRYMYSHLETSSLRFNVATLHLVFGHKSHHSSNSIYNNRSIPLTTAITPASPARSTCPAAVPASRSTNIYGGLLLLRVKLSRLWISGFPDHKGLQPIFPNDLAGNDYST
jgi:hypothetical protein